MDGTLSAFLAVPSAQVLRPDWGGLWFVAVPVLAVSLAFTLWLDRGQMAWVQARRRKRALAQAAAWGAELGADGALAECGDSGTDPP